MSKSLGPDKALIFRVTHRDNLPWILANGLHCQKSKVVDPNFITIGNLELIEKRRRREVPIPPGGMLEDYVPFYFTPYSPMMYNITTGWGGITQRRNDEIVILVSSLFTLKEKKMKFVFTDRHANMQAAEFYSELDKLDCVDWTILQNRDFKKGDPDDPGKAERYQAEALVHQHVPVASLRGVVCYTEAIANIFRKRVLEQGLNLDVKSGTNWYF